MARKAIGKTNIAAPGETLADFVSRRMPHWRRLFAELDTADVAAAARVPLAAAALQAPAMPVPELLPIDPQVRFDQLLKAYPRRPDEKPTPYAHRLYPLLQAVPLTKQWTLSTLKRRLREK